MFYDLFDIIAQTQTHAHNQNKKTQIKPTNRVGERERGRGGRELGITILYLTTQSTHFIYGYMTSDHSDSKRGNPLPPLHGLLFAFSRKGSIIFKQYSTYHSLCSTNCGALAGKRNSSMGSPWRIDPNDLSHHERTLLKWSYILLLDGSEAEEEE